MTSRVRSLAEPVAESCDWLDNIALWTCRSTNGISCEWYHGTWQYLRILNLVSNPGWHSDFLIEELGRHCADLPRADVLISGCSDYSTFAHASAGIGAGLRATVLDWCPTPLVATRWYARHHGLPEPRLLCQNAVEHRSDGGYDVIVSDSFLPRFAPAELQRLLGNWVRCLRPGGIVITTVRLHDRADAAASGGDGDAGRERTVRRWRQTAVDSAPWWPAVSTLPPEELADRVATFAQRQERNAMYERDEVVALMRNAGFNQVACTEATVNGKRFARLTAR